MNNQNVGIYGNFEPKMSLRVSLILNESDETKKFAKKMQKKLKNLQFS